ncbi:hypothetical protein AAVH_08202 [Aphelenchoides avenae]|nr:hypothetical protein AAVH_08202 [Aphelenchus avenae]
MSSEPEIQPFGDAPDPSEGKDTGHHPPTMQDTDFPKDGPNGEVSYVNAEGEKRIIDEHGVDRPAEEN